MSDYWKQVGRVFSGTVVAQAIPVLTTLFVARLIAPAVFGEFSVWLGLVMIASVIVTARFETALAVESDGYRRKLVLLGTAVTATGVSLILSVAIASLVVFEPGVFPANISIKQLALVGPTALLVASSQVVQSWFAAEGWYDDLSLFRIAQAVGISGLQLTASFVAPSADTLSLAYGIGVLLALSFASSRRNHLPRISAVRVKVATRRVWTTHRRFAVYSLPADSINTAASHLPAIVLATRFGSEVAGHFAMAMTILGAPIALLGKSVLDVFKRHAAAAFRMRGECRIEYRQTFIVLATGSIALLFVAVPGLRMVVIALLGDNWGETASIGIVLLPLFLLRFVASPLSYMVYIAGKQHWDLLWQMCLVAVIAASLALPADLDAVLLAYSLGYSMLYVFYLLLSYRLSRGV